MTIRSEEEISAFLLGFEQGCDELLDAHEALSTFMNWLLNKELN